jgi:hypothetical protein
MGNVRSTQPSYQAPPSGQRPVSPFDRGASTAAPATGSPSPFSADQVQVQAQPSARGIQPNISLLKDAPSSLSPFSRPAGETIDFLKPAAPPAGAPSAPGQPAAPNDGKIIFTLPKEIPEGPALNNIQQIVLQEVQPVQQPQQALQLIAAHADAARSAREDSNRFTWGARYYATQAAELAEQTLQQWPQMNDGQKQVFMSKIQEYRDQSIGMLNEAKKHGITTYNEALKSNLVYNHFFTANGSMLNTLDQNTMGVVKAEIDDAWSRWNGSFQKEWQGQVVEAKGIMGVLDQTTAEVTAHLHRMNSVVSQLQ